MLYLKPEKKDQKSPEPDWQDLFAELSATATDPLLKNYYQAGAVPAATPLAEVPLVSLDIETTGLDPSRDAIVSIGLIPLDVQRIRCRQAAYWVLNPGKPLAAQSIVIHGITHSEVRKGPDLIEVLPDLLNAMAGAVIVLHCRQIERRFLDAALKERIGEGLVFPAIDTMEIESRFQRRRFHQRIAEFFGRTPKSIRLAASRTRYHLPYYTPHHALTDALATAELFQAQVAWRFNPQTAVSELWH